MPDKRDPVPPGGAQMGLSFRPDPNYLEKTVETDEGTNPNPVTASDTLKETLEAQGKHPLPES